MTIKSVCLVIILVLIPVSLFSQEKSKKELKEERKLEQQKQTEELVNRKHLFLQAPWLIHREADP